MFTYFLYNTILLLTAVFSHLAEFCDSKEWRHIFRYIVFFVLFVPSVLRYDTGADYMSYTRIFNYSSTGVEKSWIFLNAVIKSIGFSVEAVYVVAAFLIYFPLCFKLPRKDFSLFLVFYVVYGYYFESFSILRQMIAVSFVIWAIVRFEQKKVAKGALLFFIATLFHISTIITLPLLFFSRIVHFRGRIFPIFFLLFMIILFLKVNIFNLASTALMLLGSKYASYAIEKGMVRTGIGVIVKNLLCLVPVIFYYRFYRLYPQKLWAANMSFLFILISFLSAQYFMFSRVLYGIYFAQILPIGYSLRCVKRIGRLLLFLALMLNIVVFEANIGRNNRDTNKSLKLYPYYSLFEKEMVR